MSYDVTIESKRMHERGQRDGRCCRGLQPDCEAAE
jgi:hypothetical protein